MFIPRRILHMPWVSNQVLPLPYPGQGRRLGA